MSASAHGHTPAAWTGAIIAFLGFCGAGGAVLIGNVPLMFGGLGLVVVGGAVGKAMQMAGMGKTPPQVPQPERAPAADDAEGDSASSAQEETTEDRSSVS